MGSFNWQEEEGSWDATQDLAQSDNQSLTRPIFLQGSRLRRFTSIALICLLGSALVLWWWVGSVEESLSAEVLESWQIIISSEAAGDEELFINQLSGSDVAWIETQKQLLSQQAVTARGSMLSSLVMSQTKSREPEIVFSPDLTEAVLTHQVKYHDRWGREVTLLQDEVFRLGVDRWLLSPPQLVYWNEATVESKVKLSKRFAYSAPARDAELADEIIMWFEDRLDLICLSEFVYACKTAEIPKFEIQFSHRLPDQFLTGNYGNQFVAERVVFELPTPSIIGIPATSKDQKLLIEAYGELYFADYLLEVMAQSGYQHVQDGCARAIVEYAAQQVDALAPLAVSDYRRYIDFADAFDGGETNIALNDAAQLEFSTLLLKLVIPYRLQDATLTPQDLLEVNLTDNYMTLCSSLAFDTEEEWNTFNRLVEVRALIKE